MNAKLNTDVSRWLEETGAPFVTKPPKWLRKNKSEARAWFTQNGLPQRTEEDWRDTDFSRIKKFENGFEHHPPQTIPAGVLERLDKIEGHRLVFIDGVYSVEHSCLKKLAPDVIVEPWSHAISGSHRLDVPLYFGKCHEANSSLGLLALNTAAFQQGTVIYIPDDVEIQPTLEIIYISLSGKHHLRNLVVVGNNAAVTIVERYVGAGDEPTFINPVTEITAQPGARIHHYKLIDESSQSIHFGGVFMQLEEAAVIENHNYLLGGGSVRNDIIGNLRQGSSHLELNGLNFGSGELIVDNHTQVNHWVADTSSAQTYQAILDDHAKSVFRGRIMVAQDAQQTRAAQSNKNRLLSMTAQANAKPQLEIYADDVECSHGATTGQHSEDALFYLQSRGIDEAQANTLLTLAFANDALDRIAVPSLREAFIARISKHLGTQFGGLQL